MGVLKYCNRFFGKNAIPKWNVNSGSGNWHLNKKLQKYAQDTCVTELYRVKIYST